MAANIPVLRSGAHEASPRVPTIVAPSLRAASPYSGRGMWRNANEGRGEPPWAAVCHADASRNHSTCR